MRFAFFLVLVLVGSVAVLVMGRSGSDRADFTYVNPSDLNTLDPASMTWNHDFRIAWNIWEGLTTHHPETTLPVEGAAFFPTVSADRCTYTFTLRADARWSNGDAVTAADFVRGWRRALEPGTAGDYACLFTDHLAGAAEYYAWRNDGVRRLTSLPRGSAAWRTVFAEQASQRGERFAEVGVGAVSSRELVVRLKRPCPYFLDLCAFPAFLPIHASIEPLRVDFEGSGLSAEGLVLYDPQWTKPDYHARGYPGLVTNGPYRVTDWQFKRRLRLGVNPHFRDAPALACRTIDMLVYRDIHAGILAYEAGEVDFLPDTSVPYDHELVRLSRTGLRPDFHCPVVFGTYFFVFNCADELFEDRPNPFVDARVRRAFALSVDKRLLAERVLGRGDPPTDTIVPPHSVVGYTSPMGLGYDPDQARWLLAEAGFPDGRGLPVIDLLFNTGFHQQEKVCDALATMWSRELGASVSTRGKDVKSFAEDRKRRRFMIARGGWYGDYADPTTFLDWFASGNGNNDAGYADPRYDALLEEAVGETDADRRLAILSLAEQRLIRETLPVLPLYGYTQLLAIKPHVRGLYPNHRLIFPFSALAVAR